MPLHLVGETLNKSRSHYRAGAGKLVQLMRGIYVDTGDDIEAMVLRHGVRIAHYLYPQAYLSGASAILLAPTRDGRLFLSARRKQRTRIRGLEIIQNEAPQHPSIANAIIDDGMGEFHIGVSSMRQRFLEAFRLRSEHAASIDDGMRTDIATRLIAEYGNPKAAADALWALARENGWYREGEAAERYFLHQPTATPARNEAALELIVAWHHRPLGRLTHDGFEWRWRSLRDDGPQLIRQTVPGRLPPFILSLLPEGWLEQVLKDKDERALLRSGKRYMSNITVVESEAELSGLPEDVLITRLSDYSESGVFTGTYAGPGRGDIEAGFEAKLASIYDRPDTPRLSGVQIKAPMYLGTDGTLRPSEGKPFTHILKPAGTGGYDGLPAVEWMAYALGRATGFDAPDAALIAMPDSMPPALIVERFDIRRGSKDKMMIAMEDFCSVLDLPTNAKYDGTIERTARALRPLSTAPDEDLLTLLKRALFAWLIADGDMHLKNLALLKVAEPNDEQFRSVRIAPLYDAVTTRVFPRLEHDRMALKLNGKDDRLRRADFRALAAISGIRTVDAESALDDLLFRLGQAIDGVSLPTQIRLNTAVRRAIERMLDICRERIRNLN